MTVKVPLSKRVSSKLRERGFKGQRLRSQSRQVTGRTPRRGAKHEIAQVSVGQLVKGKWSKRKIQRATAAATEQLRALRRAAGRTSAATSGAALASTPDTPYFNLIYVQNNSPSSSRSPSSPSSSACTPRTTKPAGNPRHRPPASRPSPPAARRSSTTRSCPASSRTGLPAWPVRRRERSQRPRDSGNADHRPGQLGMPGRTPPMPHSPAAAIALLAPSAVAAASVRFLVSFITGRKVDTCTETSQYPQLFGVSPW